MGLKISQASAWASIRRLLRLASVWLTLSLVTFVVALSGLAINDRQTFSQQTHNKQIDSALRVEHAARRYSDQLGEAIRDGALIAGDYRLTAFLNDSLQFDQTIVNNVLLQIARLHSDFYQVRLLDAAGQERSRINRSGDKLTLVPPQALQDKSNRPYFLAGRRLLPGEIFISTIDLNIEQAKIERPFRPVLRIVVPIHSPQAELLGLFVINYDVGRLQTNLVGQFPRANGNAMLVSTTGAWMLAPESQWAWADQLGHDHRFSSRFPKAWEQMETARSGQFHTDDGWFVHHSLHVDVPAVIKSRAPTHLGSFIVHQPNDVFAWQPLQRARGVLPSLISMALLLCIICGFLTYLWADNRKRKRQNERDLKKLRLAGAIFDHTDEALIVTDANQRIVTCNKAITRITGYTPDEAIGRTPKLWASNEQDPHFYDELWTALQISGQWQGQIVNKNKDGSHFHAWENISAVRDKNGQIINFVAIMTDISELKSAQSQLEHLAYHDPLSQLPNRRLFKNNLDQIIELSHRSRARFAVALLDLDGFKVINDSLGHDAGDDLLKIISQRLKDTARKEDTVARLGGDEFALLLPTVNSPETAALTLRRVLQHLQQEVSLQGRQIHPKSSVGIALYPDDGENAVDLIKAADSAMYEAKRLRTHSFVFHSNDLNQRATRRMEVEQHLRHALTQREFRLQYQPQINLNTGEVVGFEALLRWMHPERGLISAGEFIPIAEESGLIDDIGLWVLDEACRQACEWLNHGTNDFRIAVNLSGHQLGHSNVQKHLFDALDRHRLKSHHIMLELEMTESMLMQEPHILEILKKFRDAGVSLALDDFGTGYSSLEQLRHLPVNRLKIAGVFVRDLERDADAAAVVKTIIRLGRDMNMTVLAEEIETRRQLETLRQAGCAEAQGFYFSKSLDPDEAETYLLEHKSVKILNSA